MARGEVHEARPRSGALVVEVQRDSLGPFHTCLVIALRLPSTFRKLSDELNPLVDVDGTTYFANPLEIIGLPQKQLGSYVGILSGDDFDHVRRAIDYMFDAH